jgi:hypothetical protein
MGMLNNPWHLGARRSLRIRPPSLDYTPLLMIFLSGLIDYLGVQESSKATGRIESSTILPTMHKIGSG